MLENINPYNKEQWEKYFKTTELYKKIQADYHIICFDHFVETFYFPGKRKTPRQEMATSVFSGTIFYYIDYLLRDNPDLIYDIGCGWNIFKKYFPVYGIDPNPTYADAKSCDNKVLGKYVMSINALHFTSLSNIQEVVETFMERIENGGKGFLTLNTGRMAAMYDPVAIDAQVRNELSAFKDNFLVLDVNISLKDAFLDGNVRMVLSK